MERRKQNPQNSEKAATLLVFLPPSIQASLVHSFSYLLSHFSLRPVHPMIAKNREKSLMLFCARYWVQEEKINSAKNVMQGVELTPKISRGLSKGKICGSTYVSFCRNGQRKNNRKNSFVLLDFSSLTAHSSVVIIICFGRRCLHISIRLCECSWVRGERNKKIFSP